MRSAGRNRGGEFVDVGNLNPGDRKSSYLTVHNDGEYPLTYSMDIKKTDGKKGEFRGLVGHELDEILEFIVERDDGTVLFDGLLGDFERLDFGKMSAGAQEKVYIKVYFPEEADNEYQGSNVTIKFAFHATCEAGSSDDPRRPGGGGSGPGKPGEDPDVPEGLELEPGEEPVAPPVVPDGPPDKPDEELLVPQEDTPAGPGLPRTGQLPPWLFYGGGLLLIPAGVFLRRWYRAGER